MVASNAQESRHALAARMAIVASDAIQEAHRAAQVYPAQESWQGWADLLASEVDELMDEIQKADDTGVIPANMVTEAIQVASIALRLAAHAKAKLP